MQDRVSLYPGRVKLVPVAGQENTYDMVRADSPTQEGTPLNTDSLLKVATAALYGLPNTAVPDEVLAFLSKAALLDENGNVTDFSGVVKGVQIETGSYVGTGASGSTNPCILTFSFIPSVFIVQGSSGSRFSDLSMTKGDAHVAIWLHGQSSLSSTSVTVIPASLTGTTLSYYSSYYSDNDIFQFNVAGKNYSWVAINFH